MNIKTPEQLLEIINKRNQMIADDFINVIWSDVERRFDGEPLTVLIRNFTHEKWERVETYVKKIFDKNFWEIEFVKFNDDQREGESYISLKVSPLYEQTRTS